MRVIYISALCIFCLILAASGEETLPPGTFQATIRGDGTSGVVVIRQLDAGEISGDALIFYQGEKFTGTAIGRVASGSRMLISLEASAKVMAGSKIQRVTGSFETPFPTPPRNCVSGSGSLTFDAGNSKSSKGPNVQNIKVQILQTPAAFAPS
jgi:hypothetical protein